MDIVQLIGFVVSMLALLLLSLKQGRDRRRQEDLPDEVEEQEREGESPEMQLQKLMRLRNTPPKKVQAQKPPQIKQKQSPVNLPINPYEVKRKAHKVPGRVLLKGLKSLKEMVILNEIIGKAKWKE